tara:strand:+ start:10176 stop:10385 length:210 start_codon:yes stop_codon:yes gene_type:complete
MMKMPIEQYEEILLSMCDMLENGDVIEDFVDEPNRATALTIIHSIITDQLDKLKDQKEVLRLLNEWKEA